MVIDRMSTLLIPQTRTAPDEVPHHNAVKFNPSHLDLLRRWVDVAQKILWGPVVVHYDDIPETPDG